jgi:hypothetical protein
MTPYFLAHYVALRKPTAYYSCTMPPKTTTLGQATKQWEEDIRDTLVVKCLPLPPTIKDHSRTHTQQGTPLKDIEPSKHRKSNALEELRAGRPPTQYEPEIAEAIVSGISNGKTLRSLCAEWHLDMRVPYRWANSHQGFGQALKEARQVYAHWLVDGMQDLEDKIESDQIHNRAAKVILESQRWRAAQLNSQHYGDHKHVTVDSRQVQIQVNATRDMQDDVMAELAKKMAERAESLIESKADDGT